MTISNLFERLRHGEKLFYYDGRVAKKIMNEVLIL